MSALKGWRGSARIGSGWAVFEGAAGDNEAHAHLAVQLTIGISEPFALWTPSTQWQWHHVAVIGAGHVHRLGAEGRPILSLYADAQSTLGRALAQRAPEGLCNFGNDVAVRLLGALRGRRDAPFIATLLDPARGAAPPPVRDALIDRLIELARSAAEVPTGPELAAATGLSLSRLGHRFRAATGLALRPYLRWLRLERASALALAGEELTTAAHAAGFADASHFTRTFVRHFGISPSRSLQRVSTPDASP